jgi:hypothetical protein
MRQLFLLLVSFALGLGTPAFAQTGIHERDQHYRSRGPGSSPSQYKYYKAPRTYYPRRIEDADKPRPVPRADMRVPGSTAAPSYGAPPPALERVPQPKVEP